MENAASSTGAHVGICITSATTDCARMEIAASSTGDHVDLYITSATTDYTHMENAASSTGDHVWRTPLHRPTIMYAEGRFIDRRSC